MIGTEFAMVNAVRLTRSGSLPLLKRIRILVTAGRIIAPLGTGLVKMMDRVIVLATCALALAACSSTPDWMNLNLDVLKPSPITDSVRFESEPSGAEAKTSTGQVCRTPCALALPVTSSVTVTFSLAGFQPETETVEPIVMTGTPTQMRPNPVVVELTPAPPPPKPVRPAAPPKKPTKPKPASPTRPKPSTTAAPAAAPQAQPAQQGTSPWPSAPQQR